MIYDYECKIHGVFEVQQSIKDLPLKECPQCVKTNSMECHCKSCDNIWFIENKSKEPNTNIVCGKCSGNNISCGMHIPKKLISLSSFILKGGGWASEGYK